MRVCIRLSVRSDYFALFASVQWKYFSEDMKNTSMTYNQECALMLIRGNVIWLLKNVSHIKKKLISCEIFEILICTGYGNFRELV